MTQQEQDRKAILAAVADYFDKYHKSSADFKRLKRLLSRVTE